MTLTDELIHLRTALIDVDAPISHALLPGLTDDEIIGLHNEVIPAITWAIPDDALEWWRFWGGAEPSRVPEDLPSETRKWCTQLSPTLDSFPLRRLLERFAYRLDMYEGLDVPVPDLRSGTFGLLGIESDGSFLAVHPDEADQRVLISVKDDLGWLPLAEQGRPPGSPSPTLTEWVRALAEAITEGRVAPRPYMDYINKDRSVERYADYPWGLKELPRDTPTTFHYCNN
ncbi:MAG: hypothetical protein ACE367_22215 [Acidimicrobiales bacterium]